MTRLISWILTITCLLSTVGLIAQEKTSNKSQAAMQSIIWNYNQALKLLESSPTLTAELSTKAVTHLQKMAQESEAIKAHAQDYPHIAIYVHKLHVAIADASVEASALKRDAAIDRMLHISSACQSCHEGIQLPKKPEEGHPQLDHLFDFQALDGAEHALMVRDYPKALGHYITRYKNPSESEHRRAFAAEKIIDLGIRIIGTKESITQALQVLEEAGFVHTYTSLDKTCVDDFQQWLKHNAHISAIELYKRGIDNDTLRTVNGCDRLTNHYLAGRLGRMQKTGLSEQELAEIHYAQSMLLMTLGVSDPLDQAELLLRRSIELAPKSDVARDAYRELRYLWNVFYSDSRSGVLPIDIYKELEELKEDVFEE